LSLSLSLSLCRLCKCSLTEEDCADVVAALRTNPSHLQELDLSDNTVGSRGVKELSDLLQNSNCTLEKLKINNCSLLQQQCEDLAEALKSNSSLIELHLRQNDPDSVLILLHYLHNSNRKLNLRILNNPEAEKACDRLTEVLGTNPLLQKELDLIGKISGDSGVKQLSALLKDPLCRSEKLRLRNSSVTERSCSDLISALTTNPSHLTELDLSENTLGNAGVIQISTLLKTPSCKLHTLLLSDCNIKHEGYAALTEALRSNPSSPLRELDLRGNHPGESGVKEIRNLMNDPEYKLKTLRLLKSPDAQKSYLHLREVLGINPILQTDLDLSGKIEGDSGVEHLSALLKDPHCRPEKLQLSECNMTVKGCSALLEALRSESSTLRELNLSKNRIQDSGVKLLSAELKRKHCKLETVRLSDCSITEEGYTALAEALRSNPSSHLKELDLRGNDPGASGVKKLIEIQKNHKLETLRLYKEGSIKEDDCVGLFSALDLNPSHLRELNLNRNKPGESGLRNLCDLLKNPECKLQKLQTCKILSDESCADVASALCTNPSHIRDLDLSGCKLGDAGVKKLCDLLKKDECKLEKLRLKQCRISDGSCSALTEALKLHSHLKKLDLRNTKVNAAVKKQLSEILERSGGSLM
ncbi:NACHT, LRR and PYD domains-containing protein 12 isoform X19, partial [Silurus asotus]